MKRLLIIHTGGTISMSQDQTNKVITNEENQYHNIKISLVNMQRLTKSIFKYTLAAYDNFECCAIKRRNHYIF